MLRGKKGEASKKDSLIWLRCCRHYTLPPTALLAGSLALCWQYQLRFDVFTHTLRKFWMAEVWRRLVCRFSAEDARSYEWTFSYIKNFYHKTGTVPANVTPIRLDLKLFTEWLKCSCWCDRTDDAAQWDVRARKALGFERRKRTTTAAMVIGAEMKWR